MRLNPRVLLLTPRRFATALPDFAFAPRPRAAPRRSLADAELAAMADEIIAMSRPEFLAKYGNQISAKLQALGFSSVDEFLAAKEGRRREENAKVLLGLRRDGDRMDVLKVKEMGAGGAAARPKAKAAKPAEAQAGPAQAAGMAPKPLSSIIQMDKFAQLDAEKMEELWKAYHADKDVLCAVVPVEAYDKIMRNGRDFPVFLIPLPREKGFEFFLLQFQNDQIHFTSLHAYQTLGPVCRPYLTLTMYPDFSDKGIVLMRGEVDPGVLGTQLKVEEARMLALYMQAYYVEPNERKKELLRVFTREPAKFQYQDVIDEMEKLA